MSNDYVLCASCDKVPFKPEHTYDTALQNECSYTSIVEELRAWKEQHKKFVSTSGFAFNLSVFPPSFCFVLPQINCSCKHSVIWKIMHLAAWKPRLQNEMNCS